MSEAVAIDFETVKYTQPEPRIGDAYRRTHSVPPPVFRAPKPAPGGEGT